MYRQHGPQSPKPDPLPFWNAHKISHLQMNFPPLPPTLSPKTNSLCRQFKRWVMIRAMQRSCCIALRMREQEVQNPWTPHISKLLHPSIAFEHGYLPKWVNVWEERWMDGRLLQRIISRALQSSFGPCVVITIFIIIIITIIIVREGGEDHLVITVAVGSSTRVTSVHLAQELAGWWHLWILNRPLI